MRYLERLDTNFLYAIFKKGSIKMIAINKDKKMKHYKKWAEGRNKFMAPMALRIAGFSEYCFILCESVRNEKRIEGDVPLPSLKTWLKLYKNPKRIRKAIFDAMSDSDEESIGEAYILKMIDKGAGQLQKNSEKVQNELKRLTKDKWGEIKKNSDRMMEEFEEIVINDFIKDANTKEKEYEEFKKNFKKPEFVFLMRVMAPCFSIYKTYPLELLNKAQGGNDDALEKLIRLDKSVIFEPKISEIIHQAQSLKERGRITMIKKAFTSPPVIPMKMRTIKCHLGGLISYFSEKLGQKITATDIWKLYDAIALDTTGDIDYDLDGINEETFAKEIQNARKMWQVILLPEKK